MDFDANIAGFTVFRPLPTINGPVLCSTCKGCKVCYDQDDGFGRSHQLLGTMRRHSVLDFVTLWGGLSIFLMVVVYIVAKRSFYFVPNFARNVVMMPFRSR